MPTGEGGAGSGRAGLAEKEAHHAALARPQGQAAAGGEVELPRIPADFRESRGEAAAAEPFLEGPERLAGTADPDEDQAGRIEAEGKQAGTIGKAALARRRGLQNPENRPFFGDEGEEGGGKAGGRADIREAAPDFMQGVAAETPAQSLVEGGDSEGHESVPPWLERGGLFWQPPGIADFSVEIDAGEAAFDLGDPAPQPGNVLSCHGSAPAHGDNPFVPCLFY